MGLTKVDTFSSIDAINEWLKETGRPAVLLVFGDKEPDDDSNSVYVFVSRKQKGVSDLMDNFCRCLAFAAVRGEWPPEEIDALPFE